MVDKAARGGETVLKHLENKGNTCFLLYFIKFSVINQGLSVCLGVFSLVNKGKNRGFFGVEGPPYGVSNLH